MAVRFKPCSVADCKGNAHSDAKGATGLCGAHYQRKRNHGSLTAGRVSPGVPLAWLHNHADHAGDECLLWPFGSQTAGYGRVFYQGRQRGAHEVMCELAHGPKQSPEHEAAHGCGIPACVNPRHIRWDTRAGNFGDKKSHGTLLCGERCTDAKLTDEQVIWMRLNFGKLAKAEMARQCGVTFMAASSAIRGRTWSHLNEQYPPPPGA